MTETASECLVDFEPIGCRVVCESGDTILDSALKSGIELVAVCGGEGTCGQCLVRIIDGPVSDHTSSEREMLDLKQIEEDYRLACQTCILGDVKVDLPLASRSVEQRLQLLGEENYATFAPVVHEHLVTLAAPTVYDPRSDLTLLRTALNRPSKFADHRALQHLPGLLNKYNRIVRVSLRDGEILNIRPPESGPLGLAVDIGTTKVAAYLVDMETGETLAVDGITNPQVAYGEDVMSRISYAMQGGSQQLTNILLDGLNELIRRLCPEPERIVDAVIVGNTAMHHLFTGLPVRQLGLAPYAAVVSDPMDVKARDLGLRISPGAYIHLLPNVAGFIGADHVAMILATGLDQTDQVVVGLDIGTNTEVVLSQGGKLLSCSTASGPALEGAHIKHGIRAVNGAIDKIELDNSNVRIRTIGGSAPIGLCGSGVLDIVDQLHQAGLLNRRGRLLQDTRIQEGNGSREFLLVPAEQSGTCNDIIISEKDISEVLLAKAAINTGISALIQQLDIPVENIDRIILAGAFGTHIDIEAAIGIGLLPALPLDRIKQVGNAAGVGARLALTSAPHRQRALEIAQRIQYLELMTQPNFRTQFAHAMFLPER
ncbi:MAG: DUF4445 domain-containing protein [Anaerolineales bacterium]|nr:DUF4445 domain-containing protein [Anaerolineales bacterium]